MHPVAQVVRDVVIVVGDLVMFHSLVKQSCCVLFRRRARASPAQQSSRTIAFVNDFARSREHPVRCTSVL